MNSRGHGGVEACIKEKNVAGMKGRGKKRISASAGGGHRRCVFNTLSNPEWGKSVFISVIVNLLDPIM